MNSLTPNIGPAAMIAMPQLLATVCPGWTACPARDTTCGSPATLAQNQWGTNFAYGAGVQARMGSLAVRADYERIDASSGTPDLFSLGVSWTF